MARARNIKPGFFTNEYLAECEPLARILFAGLWCWADREGRLEERPKRFKAEILPYDNCDIEKLLDQLASRGFITRYIHKACRCIQIVKFSTHQNPHVKERVSTIPAPDLPGSSILFSRTNRADSLILNPESGLLNPESNLCGLAATVSVGTAEPPTAGMPTEDRTANEPSEEPTEPEPTEDSYPELFEKFWKAYPSRNGRKRGKSAAYAIWCKEVRAADRDALVGAAENYATSDEVGRGYVRDPERFLKNKWWKSFIEKVEPSNGNRSDRVGPGQRFRPAQT